MNYSKWELLDVSSDDDDPADYHPNVDPRLIRRLKKEKRQREKQEAIEELRKEAASGGPGAAAAQKRLDQVEEMKRLTLREVSSRTVINKSESDSELPETGKEDEGGDGMAEISVPEPASSEPPSSLDETATASHASPGPQSAPATKQEKKKKQKIDPFEDTDEAFVEFSRLYQEKCIQYAQLTDFEESEKFLLYNYRAMLHKHAQGCLLLEMLDLEMDGKTETMKRYCRQYLMLANILDLARGMNADPRAALRPFFERVKTKEATANLAREVENFSRSIQLRAEEKKRVASEEEEDSDGPTSLGELSKEERIGPGGLDPVEVFAELPESWQEAFSTRDMAKLQAAIRDVPLEEAQRLLKRCEDAGLWNPGPQDDGDDEGDDGDGEDAQ